MVMIGYHSPSRSPSSLLLLLTLYVSYSYYLCHAYVPPEVKQRWKEEQFTMEKALKVIEERSPLRVEKDYELYYATRFIDRNGHLFYRTENEKQALWEEAKGSWELLMGYESNRDQFFVPYPDFRDFAMAFIIVGDDYFGKGIGLDTNFAFVAMGGPSRVNKRTRQLYMDYQDFYINGRAMPDWDLSYFMRGYARNWYAIERKRPPLAFTLIGVTDKILVVRGSKTGGMAIFRRIKGDMSNAAYGSAGWVEQVKDLWKSKIKK